MEITSAGEDGESWEDKYRSKWAPVSLCWERNGTPLWAGDANEFHSLR